MKYQVINNKYWYLKLALSSLLILITTQVVSESTATEAPISVQITDTIPYIDVKIQNGKTIRIDRVQDESNIIDFEFGRTSRPCPPFCILPMSLGPGIETVGEIEVLDALQKISAGDKTTLVIDARTTEWLHKGVIPGAVSIPWKKLHLQHTTEEELMEILEFDFGVVRTDQLLNFENAKTLVIYCNGNWCGQSSTVIRSLRSLGYPVHKLKWYRGGVQAWKMLGLTLVLPDGKKAVDF